MTQHIHPVTTQPPHATACGTRSGDPPFTGSPRARSRSVFRVFHVAVLISFLLVILPIAVGATLVQTHDIPTSTYYLGSGGTFNNHTQSMTAAGTGIDKIAVYMKRNANTPTRDITIRVRSSLSGPDLATGTITIGQTSTTADWEEATITGGSGILTKDATFYIMFDTVYPSTKTYLLYYNSTNPYAGGQVYYGYYQNGGGSYVNHDILMRVWFTDPAPVADFTASPSTGAAPLTVQFNDASTNSPTSWSWNFGDGNTSTSQNPSNTYVVAGTYTVALTATNAAGSDPETKTGYITVTVTTPTPTPTPTVTPTPTPTPSVINGSSLSLSTSTDLISVRRGDLVNITVQMTAWDSLPSDSIVLLDRSGDSMYSCMARDASYNCLGTRWDYAKEGAEAMVTNLNTQHSKYALFTFSTRGKIEHSFVSSPWPINNTLANMSYEPWNSTATPYTGKGTGGYPGTSNLRDGLYKAITELKTTESDHQRSLVVFTDGEFNYYGNPLAWGRGYAMTTKIRNYWHGQTGCGNNFNGGNYTLIGSSPGPSDWGIWEDRMVWPRTSSRLLFPITDYLYYNDLQGYLNFTGFDFVASNQCAQAIDPLALWFPQSAVDWPSNPMGHDHPNIEQYRTTDYQIEVCDPSWPYIDENGVEHGNCALTEQNMSVYARNNGIRIYTVVISTQADLSTGLPSGVSTSDDIMKILSLSTGGKYYPVRNHAALLAAIADINREVSNAATDDLTMDVSDRDVDVNDALTPNTASQVFGHVHRDGISTTIHNLTGKYTLPVASDWNGGHVLHYNIGDLSVGDSWKTVYTIQPGVRGTISVFGNTSRVTFKDGTTFSLPETTIHVENAPPVFDEMGEQTVDIHETLTFTVHATDADGDPLAYSRVTLPTGAAFDTGTQIFTWAPTQKGSFMASFSVSDGYESDSLSVPITVTDLKPRIIIR